MRSVTFIINHLSKSDLISTLDNIETLKYNFDKIKIIIIDDVETKKIENQKLNISYIKADNLINGLKKSISIIDTDYVNVINSKIEEIDKKLLQSLDNGDLYCFNGLIIGVNKSEFIYKEENSKIVENIESYYFKPYLLDKINLKYYGMYVDEYFILIDLLSQIDKVFVVNKKIHTQSLLEHNPKKGHNQYKKEWYIESIIAIKEYIKEIKVLNHFAQNIIINLIYMRYNCNVNDNNKGILLVDDFENFELIVSEILSYIDDNVILNDVNHVSKNTKAIPQEPLILYFLKNKYNYLHKKLKISIHDNYLYFNDVKYKSMDEEFIKVYAINSDDNILSFDCETLINSYIPEDKIEMYVSYGTEKYDVKKTKFYALYKVFGSTILDMHTFSFQLSLNSENLGNISLHIIIDNQDITLPFSYQKIASKLSDLKHAFWKCGDFILSTDKNSIKVEKSNFLKLFLHEFKFDICLLTLPSKLKKINLILIRILYYFTNYLSKKDIWITFDKLYKAGDNGEYIFKYGLEHNKNIYYIIDKDSLDYKRVKEYGGKHVLIHNSLKSRLYALHSSVILDTHATLISYCGFEGDGRRIAAGLFNPKIVCIQHGLTVQQIAQYQHRLFDNIHLYCCASEYEIKNIKQDIYGYRDEQIKLTGLARYDGLKNKEKKIILITPTWRRNIVESTTAHTKKSHSEIFRSSQYYKIYNSLINNEKLIEEAKKRNYKIIYLLHPAMSAQKDDYTPNEYVEVIAATGDMNYEKILTESSVMITDYSGVQFDFAYQRKPIVYYHPSKLPPHYDEGLFKYDTMGFGKICTEEKELVDEIISLMKKDFHTEEKYLKRENDFFAFSDFNNCSRIVEEVEKFLKR